MKPVTISILVGLILVGGALTYAVVSGGSNSTPSSDDYFSEIEKGALKEGENVSVADGKQIIELRAKGGYTPRRTEAKAGVPTILRVNTQGTFDCSSIIRIPSLNIAKNLPRTGTIDIDLGSPAAGTLDGTCGMGMYPFEITFKG